jgi:XTP/dITP diphosphohydrolase
MNTDLQNRKLVFATHNKHKIYEIRQLLGSKIDLLSLDDMGCESPLPEHADTLEGNAAQKAYYVYNHYQVDCFADDTGLEIDALNGEPGVFSARYAGESGDDELNMNLVLSRMAGIENRKARFRTVIALVEKGELKTFEGIVNGSITLEKSGEKGFGYDPIFRPEGFNKTFAEMTLSEKNAISHRGRAIEAFSVYFSI